MSALDPGLRLEVRNYAEPGVTYTLELPADALTGLRIGSVVAGRVVQIERRVIER